MIWRPAFARDYLLRPSPETFLREAIRRLIESSLETVVAFDEAPQHAGFVPQPQTFSVYE